METSGSPRGRRPGQVKAHGIGRLSSRIRLAGGHYFEVVKNDRSAVGRAERPTAGLFLITYLIVVIILGFYWSRSPEMYDVREQALSLVNHDESRLVTGIIRW